MPAAATTRLSNSMKRIKEYADNLREEGKLAPSTVDTYENALAALSRRFEDRGISFLRVRREQLAAEFAEAQRRGARAPSVALWNTAARRFFRDLLRRGLVDENPASTIPSPKKASQDTPRLLTASEMDTLLDDESYVEPSERRNLMIFSILATTPLKISRICTLKLGDIDLVTGVGPTVRKERKKVPIRIESELLGELREYVANDRPKIVCPKDAGDDPFLFPSGRESKEGHLTRQTVWQALKKKCREVGLNKGVRTKDILPSYKARHAA